MNKKLDEQFTLEIHYTIKECCKEMVDAFLTEMSEEFSVVVKARLIELIENNCKDKD